MNDNVSGAVERADQSLNVLDAIIEGFDDNAPGMHGDREGVERRPRLFVGNVPVVITDAVRTVIKDLKGVLSSAQPSVEPGLSQRPPKWWRDAVEALRLKADESARASPLLDAFLAFKPYLCLNPPSEVVKFILISNENDLRLDTVAVSGQAFRNHYEPYTQKFIVVFQSDIDEDVRRSLIKAGCEVVGDFDPCNKLLRDVLDEFRMLVE